MRRGFLYVALLLPIMGVIAMTVIFIQRPGIGQVSPDWLDNVADYTFMWWAYGWRGRSPEGNRVLCVQTSRYGLAFDLERASITHLGAISRPLSEDEAVAQSNDLVLNLPASELWYTLKVGGRAYRSARFALPADNARIIESGKFLQRMELLSLEFEDESRTLLPGLKARLELVCWPDRAALILHHAGTDSQSVDEAELHLVLNPALRKVTPVYLPSQGGGGAGSPAVLCLAGDGSRAGGIILLNPSPNDDSEWSVREAPNGQEFVLRYIYSNKLWKPGQELSLAIALMPVAKDALAACHAAVAQETQPLSSADFSAEGIAPYQGPLEVRYDRQRGWYEVALGRHDQGWVIGEDPDRLERVRLLLRNPDDTPHTVRLNLAKDYDFAGIVGMSPMIRDAEGYPTGLPVQISKDWHGWVWFHGLTMLTLPPKTTLPLEFTMAYARWGGVPAASHAQLCLVGWGTNQLWDESAVGCFGESICYDLDVNLNRSMIDDVRPLMVWSMTKDKDAKVKWGWTNNVGGGDFLYYAPPEGGRQYLSRMRTSYRRYSPCLTEVTYAGITPDGHIAARITVSTARTDDIVRGFYRFRYDVLEPTPFKRLAFFQLGADGYNDHWFEMIARGDAPGIKEEWKTEAGGLRYHRTGILCEGEQPWFSLHRASTSHAQGGAWANRGLVIRSWKARLGGKERPVPYAAVFGTVDRVSSANIELSPPPEVKELEKGDFVEAEVEMVVMPMSAEDYYGPNEPLRQALAAHPDSWEPIWREAAGNALKVKMQRGKLERSYPLRVAVDAADRAELAIEGGVGYVPMTFAGLSTYRGIILERDEGRGWERVDQSVHGNDYWQADYDSAKHRWEITFNVPLDSPTGTPGQARFRLRRE